MSLKILFLDAYNNELIKSFIRKNKDKIKTYTDGNKLFTESNIGISGYYSKYLNKIGHQAHELIGNCVYLQDLWIKEHDLDFDTTTEGWFYKLLEIQIKEFNPDVIYCRTIIYYDVEFLARMKKYTSLIAGHNACPLSTNLDLSVYKFISSPALNYLNKFKQQGSRGELLKFGFDPDILSKIKYKEEFYDVSFVGGFGPDYKRSTPIFEEAANKVPIDFWGPDYQSIFNSESPILKNYHGEAWGIDMYNVLANSKISLNRHIDVVNNHASNIRLTEVTGSGSLLLTDGHLNLESYFEPNKEVITYKTANDLVDKVNYFLKNENERLEIAKAGQNKTLTKHNYEIRMKELVSLIYKYI